MYEELPIVLTVDCQPFILIFALRKLHDLSQTATTKCCLCILSQLIACGALRGISGSELVFCALVAIIL